ncbi:ferredoxin [Streptomyces sp. UNOC14_S4]|uniref:ferredoxin n=1 Tax=Streptomyces sp. UNOC14_S4 TaxID=2872340 RepID=UPI001E3CA8A1|nr:ferredoxin [Streptomyces sp. UNOC14_S4]MCC3773080.1 ferredoxin [Streptomyces sp. UNOC14_S4]
MSITRVSIDSDLCVGSGQCAATAPGVFSQDDDGFGLVIPGKEDGSGDPRVSEAARACPSRAISVDED